MEKIEKIIAGGADNLHIVTDFDRTLTMNMINGVRKQTSASYFRDEEKGYMPDSYIKKASELAEFYHPVEIDPNIGEDEKSELMMEWWTKHMQLFVAEGVSQKVIDQILEKEVIPLRKDTKELLDLCAEKNIPILIFSAGIGNIITGLLSRQGLNTPNVHIISNFFQFDENGIAIGYSDKIIHVLNKHETEIKDTPYFVEVDQRDNVIVMGDRLGDARMAEGLEHDTVLKVGFLNEKIEEGRSTFEANFDLIIENDGPMTQVFDIVKQASSHQA